LLIRKGEELECEEKSRKKDKEKHGAQIFGF
jgi:hypothetical protein